MSLATFEDRVIVEACAEIITGKRPADEQVNLYGLVHRFHDISDDIVAELAQHVKALTDGKYTVRRAKSYLFENRAMGPYLYLAYCHLNNPEPVIDTVTSDVLLVGFGPYRNGFEFPATPASAHAVEAARVREGESRREKDLCDQARDQAQQLVNKLVDTVRYMLRHIVLPEAVKTAAVQALGSKPTLESIALTCIYMNTSLDELIVQAAQT